MNTAAIANVEFDLVAAAFFDPRITDTITLTEETFYRPTLGAAWDAIRRVHAGKRQPSPILVVEEAAKVGARIDPAMLVDMVGQGLPANAEYLADRVRDGHRRRMIREACVRAMQALEAEGETDEIVSRLSRDTDSGIQSEAAVEAMETLDEFCDRPLPTEEWVIPNLIARGDRTVVTGEEGFGKSVMIRQIAVCAAAGLHPFTGLACEPKRVLVVDAENPRRIMQQRMAELREGIRIRNRSTGTRMWIQRYPQGFDLTKTHNKLTLHSQCRAVNPDLLVIGPIYKLFDDDGRATEETVAKRLAQALDSIREEFDCALIVEAHSPHATGGQRRDPRPIGSSLWRRWSEFGIGLMPEQGSSRRDRKAEIVHWRGARDGDRPWPDRLESGSNGMPWVVADPMAYMAEAS